jgi:hypothetical protein
MDVDDPMLDEEMSEPLTEGGDARAARAVGCFGAAFVVLVGVAAASLGRRSQRQDDWDAVSAN